MGTLLDLNKQASYDYVDNTHWSAFQIRIRYLLHKIYVEKNFDKLKPDYVKTQSNTSGVSIEEEARLIYEAETAGMNKEQRDAYDKEKLE